MATTNTPIFPAASLRLVGDTEAHAEISPETELWIARGEGEALVIVILYLPLVPATTIASSIPLMKRAGAWA